MTRCFLVIFLLALPPAFAGEAAPAAADPQLEARLMHLASELRCLVCQNQSLADSHADLAVDLKNQVREKMKQGMSDREIVDYMVARYGDFVLYRPPMKGSTLMLWFGPFLLLVAGLAALFYRLRTTRPQAPELTEADHARAAALLAADDKPEAR